MRFKLMFLSSLLLLLGARAGAQKRPLETEDPQTLGLGQVAVAAGVTYARDVTYPLSGLSGNLWQIPLLGLDVGIGPIADLQFSWGFYDRLNITSRQNAPLAYLIVDPGDHTHAVHDLEIATKIRLLAEDGLRPAAGVRFSVRLPNAKHESGLGQDTTDFSASLLLAKTFRWVHVVGNGGFTIMSEPLDAAKQNDVFTYGVAVTRKVHRAIELVAEANGRVSTRPQPAPVGTEGRGIATVGGRFRRGTWQVDMAALVGLTSLDTAVGVTIGVTRRFTAFTLQ